MSTVFNVRRCWPHPQISIYTFNDWVESGHLIKQGWVVVENHRYWVWSNPVVRHNYYQHIESGLVWSEIGNVYLMGQVIPLPE